MKRKITWVEDSASVAKLSAGFSLFFFTYPGTIIALQMKKCRIARHNLTNICSQTLLSFCGVFAGGGIVSLLDYSGITQRRGGVECIGDIIILIFPQHKLR